MLPNSATWEAIAEIPQHRHAHHPRRNLFEQLQPLCSKSELRVGKSGGVAAGPRQARNQAAADRVDDIREHDRHAAGRFLQRAHRRVTQGHDGVRCERDQFGSDRAVAVDVAGSPAVIDAHIAADDPAQFAEPLQEGCVSGLVFRIIRCPRHEHADAPYARRLLRSRRERPRHRAAE